MALVGQQLGRYHLIRLLGSGGMGEVYLAEDASIQRQVAIKVMRTETALYPNANTAQQLTRLFQREARAIATLDHPHILPLYDYGEATLNGETITYLVMPYRPEGSLVTWLRQRSLQQVPLQTQDIVHFVQQAAEALQHAHDHQIIHQDVKPANFLIRHKQGNPNRPDLLLTDFGIARFTTATASASQSVRGTPAYMAPEQLEGHALAATDQYELAIMTYELLTGRPPFQGGVGQVMYQQLHVQPTPPSTLNPHLPPAVDAVLLHALAKRPEARFPSISAFAQAFREAMQTTDAPTVLGEYAASTSDMRATLAISDVEARQGTVRSLTLPDGRRISVSVPAGAYNGQLLRVEGQGLASLSGRTGALLITLAITATFEHPATPPVEDATAISSSTGHPVGGSFVPTPPSPPLPGHREGNTPSRGVPKGWLVFLVLVALAVIGASAGFAFFYRTAGEQTSPLNANTTLVVLSPTQAPAKATAAISNTTPTSVVPTAATPSDPYTGRGALTLNDPLQDNSQNVDWMTGTNQNNATCAFMGGAYQSTQPVDGDFHACFALNTNYHNFVYEVQMTIISGSAGGIIFRASQANSTFYYFRVGQDGSYDLRAYVDPQIADSHVLLSGSSPAIHTGYNQANILAVVADGSSLLFYANHQQITSITDSTFSQGQIGVVAYNQGGLAQVVYNNAKVWTL